MEYPKLRPLDIFPVAVSGQNMIGLRDPMNFSSEVLAIPQQLYLLLSLLDGQHSIVDIQAEYMRASGELLFSDTIKEMVQKLDDGLFLDNENFHARRMEVEEAFKHATSRPAVLAGKSYSDSSGDLIAKIESFFTHEDGPGQPPGPEASGSELKGIIAPHIDFERGGPCFAWAYNEVAQRSNADVFVIFGTAHAPTTVPHVITYKDFETPFGTLACDREIVSEIQKLVSFDLLQDEFVHRGEHSIEFQTVLLGYLFAGKKDITIVPILCGSFHEMMFSRTQPIDHPEVGEFVTAVREVLGKSGKEICLIAGADLAHVGPRFGDTHPITEGFLKLLESDDLRMLERVEALDAAAFFSDIEAEGDRRKICGLPPIYTMLHTMDASRGKLLKYEQWPDPAGTVTFASLAFY